MEFIYEGDTVPPIDWPAVLKATVDRAVLEERERCAKIALAEYEFAMNTYEGSRLHDFISVARHIEAQIMRRPHPRDKMRGIAYPSTARIISAPSQDDTLEPQPQ